MFVKIILLYVCSGFVFIDTAFLDSISKCSIKDTECLKNVYGKGILSIGEKGIPEYDIPPIDPITLKNISLSIAGFMDITLKEGIVSGITKCRFQTFSVDIVKSRAKNDISCDLIVEGKYKVSSSSPIIKSLLNGSSFHGEGNGKVGLEKVVLKLDFPFDVLKRDGDIYIKCDYKRGKYDYEILGKMYFEADNIYLGDKEASKEVVKMLNNNWKLIAASFGPPFVNKAIDIYAEYSSKLFDKVAAKNFITDDLTPYVKA